MMNSITRKPHKQSDTTLINLYGIGKYKLADLMRNNMHMPTHALEALAEYKMQHMTGATFTSLLEEGTVSADVRNNGTFLIYAVIYHGCTPFNAKRAHELRLSFRAAHKSYGIDPIVLVQIVQENIL